MVDRLHRVWIPTSRGLYRYEPGERRLRRHGLLDGALLSSLGLEQRLLSGQVSINRRVIGRGMGKRFLSQQQAFFCANDTLRRDLMDDAAIIGG